MNAASEDLANRLLAAGVGLVDGDGQDLSRYTIDGKTPAIRCVPESPEQIGVLLRTCAQTGAGVVPWGGGTAMTLGNIPHRVDVVVELARFNKLVEHDAPNLTATMQAGMPLAALQDALGRERQCLTVDPPHPARATLGGLVAANSNGPRRMAYGGIRDLVIGMKMVLPTGEQIKAGGKVVKNVAGYDMCKLFVGSLGTLGIITEVTMKMAPLPERAATIIATGPLAKGLELVDALFRSTLVPAGIALVSSEVAQAAGSSAQTPVVAVWAEGFDEAVARHLREVETLAKRIGLSADVLPHTAHVRLWERIRDFGAGDARVVVRVTVPLGSVAAVVTTVDQWRTPGSPVHYVAHAGTGTIWVAYDPRPANTTWFVQLGTLAAELKGHAVMTAAPVALKDGIDVWGPAPPSLALMRAIKQQFDPQRILNPGRFVAGL